MCTVMGLASVTGSVHFLQNYWDSLTMASTSPGVPDSKGKGKIGTTSPQTTPARDEAEMRWEPPPQGWIKINTDAAFWTQGEAYAGIIIRDSLGHAVLSSWQKVRRCGSALEAEAEACLIGIRLASAWVQKPAIIESDCWELVRHLQSTKKTRATWSGLTDEIKAASQLLPASRFSRIKRGSNSVAHALAKVAQINNSWAVWRLRPPPEIQGLVQLEASCSECQSKERALVPCKNLIL